MNKQTADNQTIMYICTGWSGHSLSSVWFFLSHIPGPGSSKLTTSLVNISLIFQMFNISKMPIFYFEKMREAFAAVQKLLSFLQQKISVYLFIKL